MFGVAGADFDQITVVSCHVVHFQDLRKRGERPGDVVVAGRIATADGYEREHPLIERAGIDLSGVSTDHAPRLEFPDPLENG